MKKITFLLLFFVWASILPAQSPPDLMSDVTGLLSATRSYTVTQIEAVFNSGRRQEETQHGLAANSIKDLDLPDQSIWDSYSDDQKMLFLMNDERTSRAGVDYGSGPVKGLPYQGVSGVLDAASQTYAELLISTSTFGHTTGGTTSSGRIDAATGASCNAFNSFSENLAVAATNSSTNTFPSRIEASIFNWNYQDGACCAWGHRRASLTQALTDDNGVVGQEGYIGVGVADGDSYTLFSCCPHANMVVFNFFDPVSDAAAANCDYQVTVTTNSLSGNSCEDAVVADAANGNADVSAISTITTSGTVNVTGTVSYKAGTSVTLNEGFHAQAGSNFTAAIEACTNSLTDRDTPTQLASARSEAGQTRFRTRPVVQKQHDFIIPTVSPNPFNQSFIVNYQLPQAATVQVDVLNLTGQKMMNSMVLTEQTKGNNQIAINGESWIAGLYLVRIQMNDQVWTKRIIKH